MRIATFGVRSQRGYSLTEMLVVVAMIGIFSLVTVPQFITMYRQAKIRAAVRQFNGHLRYARQHAITKNVATAISFYGGSSGTTAGQYGIYQRVVDTSTDPDTISWELVGNLYALEEPVYFLASNFSKTTAKNDNMHDVIFQPDGTVSSLPGTPKVEIKTDVAVPNNHCTITMKAAGTFTSVMTTD